MAEATVHHPDPSGPEATAVEIAAVPYGTGVTSAAESTSPKVSLLPRVAATSG